MWELDAFGKGKGKPKGKEDPWHATTVSALDILSACSRPSMEPAKPRHDQSASKTCGGFINDTFTCTSKGGAKFCPPPAKGKGKGKDQPAWGKGKGASQWGNGSYGKGKGKVSAFDDWPSQGGGHGTNGARHLVMPSFWAVFT